MGDPEAFAGQGLGRSEHRITIRPVWRDEVGGERDFRRACSPDVEVVHLAHVLQRGQRRRDGLRIDATGHRVEREVHALAEQPPGARDDRGCNRNAHDRIDPGCSGDRDRGARDHDPQRDRRVGCHVEEGPADVGIVVTAEEEQGGERVDHHADRGHRDHRWAGDRLGGPEAVRRLPDDAAAGHEEQHGVGEGRVDGGPTQAPGVPPRRRPPGEPVRSPGEEQTDHVAGIVARVGKQRQRPRPETSPNFRHHERRVERHADGHRPVKAGRHEPVPMPAACTGRMGVIVWHALPASLVGVLGAGAVRVDHTHGPSSRGCPWFTTGLDGGACEEGGARAASLVTADRPR